MSRTTISFTEPNEEWLQQQIQSKEFKSASDVVNAALRQIRQIESGTDKIRAKLIQAESRGFDSRTPEEIMENVIARNRADGKL